MDISKYIHHSKMMVGKRRRNLGNKPDGNRDVVVHRRQESCEKAHSSSRSKPPGGANLFYSRLQQWYLRSSQPTRILLSVASIAVAFLSITSLYDRMFCSFAGGNKQPEKRGGDDVYFAVAINTYKRPDRLRDAVRHYASACGKRAGVGQVFVVWAEQTAEIPTPESFFDDDSDNPRRNSVGAPSSISRTTNNRAYVEVLRKPKDSLNSRFEPIDGLEHDAVFMVDDDVRVDCSSLASGFEAWRNHPLAMVGYYPRLASPPLLLWSDPSSSSSEEELVYHAWPVVYLRHKFNFVLTKASFLHARYLDLYTGDGFPREIKDHVDGHGNCEDIAMAMLVANSTKHASGGEPAYPIYVEGNVDDRGLFGGISTGSGHMATRSDCLTTLTRIFRERGWGSPLAYEIPLRDYSWVRHAPGFWWQSKPSNFFEWLSFENVLT